jgi:hypothetical protein
VFARSRLTSLYGRYGRRGEERGGENKEEGMDGRHAGHAEHNALYIASGCRGQRARTKNAHTLY